MGRQLSWQSANRKKRILFLYYNKEINIVSLNKGYLTAKTDKASDETYTPAYAVKPLVKYVQDYMKRNNKEALTIWCPFDLINSKYVEVLSTIPNVKVIYTHIDSGENFFFYEPEEVYDIIISNPPFSCKDDILKRLYELNKPYAMLLPIPTLQGQARFPYMKDIQYLGFDKRINYYRDAAMTKTQDGVSFGSCYLCKDFLPKDLIIEELQR